MAAANSSLFTIHYSLRMAAANYSLFTITFPLNYGSHTKFYD